MPLNDGYFLLSLVKEQSQKYGAPSENRTHNQWFANQAA